MYIHFWSFMEHIRESRPSVLKFGTFLRHVKALNPDGQRHSAKVTWTVGRFGQASWLGLRAAINSVNYDSYV